MEFTVDPPLHVGSTNTVAPGNSSNTQSPAVAGTGEDDAGEGPSGAIEDGPEAARAGERRGPAGNHAAGGVGSAPDTAGPT